MSSSLSGIPAPKRRQLAATLGLFAVLFLAVGAVAATGANTGVIKAFVVVALVIAVLLALMAWGVLHSVQADQAERNLRNLDAAIEAAVAAHGQSMCDCGHEHDPDELHFVDGEGQHVTGSKPVDACAHDGQGTDCGHSCETCVFATARRPSPGPRRPSPLPR